MVPPMKTRSSIGATYQLEFRARASCPSLEAAVLSVRTTLSRSSEGPAFPEKQVVLGPLQSVVVLWSSRDLQEIRNANITLLVTVTGCRNTLLEIFSSLLAPPLTSAASTSLLSPPSILNSANFLRALDRSLGDGVSFDVKFLTNSKRLSSGSIYKPLPTYANSAVLEEVCPKLDTLFPGGLAYITEDDLPLPILADYDDGYDSDIDDDNEGAIGDASNMVPAQANGVEISVQPQDTGGPAPPVTMIDPGNIPGKCMSSRGANDSSVLDRSCIHGCLVPVGSNHVETVLSPSPSADSIADLDLIESALSTRTCRHEAGVQLVHVKCVAHRTWRAFVYYCYTGKVAFYPLRSQMPRNKFPEVVGATPSCSPKSMYRLADKASSGLL
ncbi:hypothetical protein PAXRUDRAFT_9405 [Paxillus rubicundulus Ve08.2h10]|uniref:Uncharacterized protein n=1 Tax=Paxillus rubicundulus Ve08.2h10 TaxID=930991 RepID=A0A0D0EC30_9AGAM|nr:hypothetical protein PAXRUDRAFT_9405 [Paxillus rubicundulus Ve08.2h10]